MNDAGLWSEPAGLSFTILPPWWRQPLRVIGLAALGIALAGGLLAVRARRLLQVERLRASIAADLHDQMGAGLTDIAILSEVAARKAGDLPELARVAATARELVDGMGDIVWLVNPRRDSLYELFLRLKDSYDELFAHAGAQLEVADLTPAQGRPPAAGLPAGPPSPLQGGPPQRPAPQRLPAGRALRDPPRTPSRGRAAG